MTGVYPSWSALKLRWESVVQNVLQSRRHKIAPVDRIISNEQAKCGGLEHLLVEKHLGHGQLVQVKK